MTRLKLNKSRHITLILTLIRSYGRESVGREYSTGSWCAYRDRQCVEILAVYILDSLIINYN